MSGRIARFMQRLSATKPCPEIRWEEVVRIEAMGTDAFSAFEIWLTLTHADETRAEITIDTKGYWDIVDTLRSRFPSISPNWYDEMSEQPWHVERTLFLREREIGGSYVNE
jgi:hypothetical protein